MHEVMGMCRTDSNQGFRSGGKAQLLDPVLNEQAPALAVEACAMDCLLGEEGRYKPNHIACLGGKMAEHSLHNGFS